MLYKQESELLVKIDGNSIGIINEIVCESKCEKWYVYCEHKERIFDENVKIEIAGLYIFIQRR